MNKYIRCNKRPTILPPSTCSAAQGNVPFQNSFPCRRVFSLVANKDYEFCLVLSCSNTPIKSKLQHPPDKPWAERAQILMILDCNDRSRRRLFFRGELTRVEWKLGEKKDILVFDRGRYSNVIYMVTWIDRYNTRSNFICDTVSYTPTRQGTCHATKQNIPVTAGAVGIDCVYFTKYGSTTRTKDSDFVPKLTPYFSPSRLGDRTLAPKSCNLAHKSDHQVEISGNIVSYSKLAPRPELLLSWSYSVS